MMAYICPVTPSRRPRAPWRSRQSRPAPHRSPLPIPASGSPRARSSKGPRRGAWRSTYWVESPSTRSSSRRLRTAPRMTTSAFHSRAVSTTARPTVREATRCGHASTPNSSGDGEGGVEHAPAALPLIGHAPRRAAGSSGPRPRRPRRWSRPCRPRAGSPAPSSRR